MTRMREVSEAERGPTVPEERLDTVHFATLAAAVIEKALFDLDTQLFRTRARFFLLHTFPGSIWSDFGTVNQAMLRDIVTERCRQKPRLKGE